MQKKSHTLALIVIMSLFFMWGFLTVLNDILIPHLKALFQLSYVEAMLIQFCFFASYGIMSLPSGKLLQAIGYKKSVVLGLCIAAIGCILFWPAAAIGSYPFFLLGLFVLATGIVILQVAANPYVSLLGDVKTASSRLNLAQAFNSLGTTLGPQVGAIVILSLVGTAAAGQIVTGIEELYVSLSLIFLAIALCIGLIKLPKIEIKEYEAFEENLSDFAARKEKIEPKMPAQKNKHAWHFPHLFFGAIAIFVYVGAEVSIGSFLVNFLSEPTVMNLDPQSAGQHVSFYWGAAMIGRFIGFVLLLKVKARKLLASVSIAAIILVLVTILGSGPLIGYTILSVGLFNSIMFPTIFTLAIAGLGKFTAQGSGILCTAIIGGAIIPIIQGLLADHLGIQHAFFIPFLCYVYILYFALKGSVAYCRVPKKKA